MKVTIQVGIKHKNAVTTGKTLLNSEGLTVEKSRSL